MANCIIRTKVCLFAAVSCLAMTATMVPPAGAAELAVVQLLGKHAGFAVNPETGDIAAIDAEENAVRLYQAAFFGTDKAPAEAKAATGSVKVGSSPSSIVFKKFKNRGVWAVVCKKDSQMYLLDSGTLGLVKKVPLSSSDVTHVYASSNAADPYVYYVHAGGPHNATNSRMNLAKLNDEGQVFYDSSDTAISATGRLFYKRRAGVSPSGVECWRKIEGAGADGKPRFDALFTDHNSTARYLPDAFEQYTIAGPMGQDVYSADLRKKLGQLGFRAECIFATRPVIAGLSGNNVMLASYNTFQTTAQQALPEALFKAPAEEPADSTTTPAKTSAKTRRRPSSGDQSQPPPTQLFADDKNGRLVAIVEDRAVAIPLSAFNLPDEPFLVVRAEVPEQLAVGQPARIALTKVDPRTQIAIGDGPEGAKIENDSLVWTPTDAQVGTFSITLQLSHQDFDRVQTLDVQVNRPVVTLPFAIEKFAVSADGKRAVCWGSETPDPRFPNIEQNAPTKIAVVDLEKLQVTAQATVPYRVGNGAIDSEFAYVSQLNSGTIQALSITDLQRKKQAINSDHIWSLNIVANTLFAGTNNRTQLVYQIPELKRNAAMDVGKDATGGVPHHMRGFPGSEAQGGLPWVVEVHDGWRIDDIVYNSDLRKVRLIGKVAGINTVGYSTPEHQVYVDPQQRPVETAWGKLRPDLAQMHLILQDRKRTLDWLVLVPYPVHLALVTEPQADSGGGRGFRPELSVRLDARDLLSGQIKGQAVLAKLENTRQPDYPNGSMGRNSLRAVGDLVFAAYGPQLFKYQFPKPSAEDFPVPLHLVPEQSALVLKTNEKTRLTHKLEGGEKPYQVALVNAVASLSVDSETADVQVDGPVLVKEAADRLVAVSSGPNTDAFLRREQQQGAVSFDEHLRNATQAYRRLLGRDPQGIPVAVPVHLRLSDASGQTAELSYFVFAEVPRQEYQARLAERDKQEAEQRKKQEVEMKKRQEQFDRERGANALTKARDVGDVGTRMLLLEQRMKSVEDRLELITRLLSDRRDSERPRPADPRGGKSIDADSKEKTKSEVNDDPFNKQEEEKR